MKRKGKPADEIADWDSLATEIIQAINSKQLIPTMRSQYMRTAFQLGNGASVRISLDTNLCMIYERDAVSTHPQYQRISMLPLICCSLRYIESWL